MRAVEIRYRGGVWVNVRAADVGGGKRRNVSQQGFNLEERRWSVTGTLLSDDERARGLDLISELELVWRRCTGGVV